MTGAFNQHVRAVAQRMNADASSWGRSGQPDSWSRSRSASRDLLRVPRIGTSETRRRELAVLQPRTLGLMHGSSCTGDGAGALHQLAAADDERHLARR